MKKRSAKTIVVRVLLVLFAALALFVLGTFIFHRVKGSKEIARLKELGYYNPVSVGDYSLNVAKFGNENGSHTIVAMAGLGSGDFSVAMRQMTASLEEDNLVVFVDRAGYGFSDDTDNDMTLEYIVEDYRKALNNAGIEGSYILMPHSIGGAYATYWVSKYPDEIEAVIFLDGSQLSENAFEERTQTKVTLGDRALMVLAKLGFSRYVLRRYFYLYPDNYTEEEQYLGDALECMTGESVAPVSESRLIARNAQDAFGAIATNDVPKLYICSSWGFETKEDIIESNKWMNRQIEKNNLDGDPRPTDYADDDEIVQIILEEYQKAREEILVPYAERMGNCKLVCLAGDHMIYEQKPEECAEIVMEFLRGLEN